MAESHFTIDDGIKAWFDGPEWNDVTASVFSDFESNIESSAKANATWEDQTGAARAGLTARSGESEGIVTMTLAHTVAHGVWLETIQSGRFAIILSTLEAYEAELMAEVARKVASARRGRN